MAKESLNIEDSLKPFFQRASEAEDRLSRLEVAVASKKDSQNEELLQTISELETKLESAHPQNYELLKTNSELQTKLESANSQNEDLLITISELQTKLESAHAEIASEQAKAKKLAVENEKHQYRILHLVRAVRHCDSLLVKMTGGLEAKAQTIRKLED